MRMRVAPIIEMMVVVDGGGFSWYSLDENDDVLLLKTMVNELND